MKDCQDYGYTVGCANCDHMQEHGCVKRGSRQQNTRELILREEMAGYQVKPGPFKAKDADPEGTSELFNQYCVTMEREGVQAGEED